MIQMSWVMERYRRLREIRRHSAGETRQIRTGGGTAKRLYLSDWVVLSRPERKHKDESPDSARITGKAPCASCPVLHVFDGS